MSDSGESGTGHTIMPLGLGLEGRATVAGSQPADWMGAAGFEPEARPGKAERLSLVRNQPTGWARLVSNQRPLACEASALPLSYAPWADRF